MVTNQDLENLHYLKETSRGPRAAGKSHSGDKSYFLALPGLSGTQPRMPCLCVSTGYEERPDAS